MPSRVAAALGVGLVLLVALEAATAGTATVAGTVHVQRLTPAPEQAGPMWAAAEPGPTRSVPTATPPPVVLGAGLTRIEATRRAA